MKKNTQNTNKKGVSRILRPRAHTELGTLSVLHFEFLQS